MLLFSMQSRISDTPPLTIDGLDSLSLDGELRIIHFCPLITLQQRNKMAVWLLENVPTLKSSAHRHIRFEEALSAHCAAVHEFRGVRPTKFNKHQLPLSFFLFVVAQLLRKPVDEMDARELRRERSAKWLTEWTTFNDLLSHYCVEHDFDGAQLRSFFYEETDLFVQSRQRADKIFELHFRKKICEEYGISSSKFQSISDKIISWHTDLFSAVGYSNSVDDITYWYTNSSSITAHVHLLAPSPSAFDPSCLVRRMLLAKPMMLKLSWSHVVEAVRHEMYARMANKLQQFDFELEFENVIKKLKDKMSGVSGNELAYIEQLVHRMTNLHRPSVPIRFDKRYVDVRLFDFTFKSFVHVFR